MDISCAVFNFVVVVVVFCFVSSSFLPFFLPHFLTPEDNIVTKFRPMEEDIRGDEWSIKIFNCSQNFTFARFARKIIHWRCFQVSYARANLANR